MGYFNGLASASFKKDPLGRTIYFPYGIVGRGRIIENEQEYKRIKKILKWRYIAYLIITIMIFFNIEMIGWWLVPFILTIAIVDWVAVLALVRHYPISEERLGYVEALRNSAKGYGKTTLWIVLLGSLFGTVQMGFITFHMQGNLSVKIEPLVLTLICGACSFVLGWMLRQLSRHP